MKQTSFIRPAISGSSGFKDLFSGKVVKMDPGVKKFFEDGLGSYFSDEEREYHLFQTDENSNSDKCIHEEFHIDEFTSPAEARANLEYLSREGSKLLVIPEGEEEVDFIFGWDKDDKTGVQYVLYAKHEFKKSEDCIYLKCRLLDHWHSDDFPKGFAKKKKLA